MDNRSGALLDFQSDASLVYYSGSPSVTNAGTLRKSGGAGSSLFSGVPLRNSGIVEAQTGTIAFNAAGTRFETGTRFLGAGTNVLLGGSASLSGAIHSDNLVFGGASIQGTNTLSGTVQWTGGRIDTNGVVTVATNGTLVLAGPAEKIIVGVLNNRGTVQFSGSGQVAIGSINVTATINNEAGGLFELLNDAPIAWTSYSRPVFVNAGTLRKSGGAYNSDLSVAFDNTGTVEAKSGVIRFLFTYTQFGGRLQFGFSGLTDFGQVQFAQAASLTGTLGINLLGGFVPKSGDAFAVISYYPDHTGLFAAFDLPSQVAWQTNSTIYGPHAVTLTVLNVRPTPDPVPNQTTDEQVLLSLSITGSDPDAGQSLTYSLLDAPDGATINTNSGQFAWTPNEAQGPSTNQITVQIADNGVPTLSATQQFTVVVREVNRAPVLMPLANCTLVAGAICWITISASDPDLPPQQLTFSLANAPPGMSIGPTSGVLAWAPPRGSAPMSGTVTVRVADDGLPPLTGEQAFVATLISDPRLKIARSGPGWVVLSWPASATDAGFVLQSTTNLLSAEDWEEVAAVPVTVAGEDLVTNKTFAPFRAYRLAAASTALPSLQISAVNPNHVRASWPASASAGGFVLQATSSPQPPAAWTAITNTVGTNGALNFIVDPTASTQRFYRLGVELR